ncbi:MAG: 4Fe-4S dicluster domain-containing protein [Planctomycetota bacterium]|jgi:Na+-transporting NADH:ubiquinone oxidoreductase subunit A
MKLRGGYNILLEGRPSSVVERLPEPKELYLPLRSRRFFFNEICVEDGQQVNAGDVIAKDTNNFALPLLTPRGGTVKLNDLASHIVLSNLSPREGKFHVPEKDLPHIVQEVGTAGMKRYKLLSLGAWQFFYDAYTGELPDPLSTPQAVIISTLSLEPFTARGDVQLHNRLLQFTRGLEHLQSLLEYQPIYLIMPNVKSPFASQVREHIRGYAWAKLVQVPLKYPYDNFNILARALGLKRTADPIWSVRAEGILAIDRTLTVSKPCLVRIVSIGGPAVSSPIHLKAMAGYPIQTVLDMNVTEPDVRILDGGLLTGEAITEDSLGLDTECRGLTILPEYKEREFLGFTRPGWDRKSYSRCFLSSLRKDFRERLTTAIRGELRPCISCNFCGEVCPAGIIPHLLHKYLYRDLIEEVEQARVDLCIECGLCSFVCPSKIELRGEFIEAKELIEKEKEEIRQEQAKQQLQENSK